MRPVSSATSRTPPRRRSRPGRACPWATTSPCSGAGARARPAGCPARTRHTSAPAATTRRPVRDAGGHRPAARRRRWRWMQGGLQIDRAGRPARRSCRTHSPSGSSHHDDVPSLIAWSNSSPSSSRCSGSATRTQRLDPAVEVAVHHVGAADVDLRVAARWRTRRCASARGSGPGCCAPGCSRSALARPGAARRCRAPTTSTGTPAWPARYSASMISSSTIELTLIRMPAGLAGRARCGLRVDALEQPLAQVQRGDEQPLELLLDRVAATAR